MNPSPSRVSRARVFHLAWPIILSNLATPLLGVVDTAVIGNLGNAALIGAIAIGGMIFSFLYWGFGFLRMGTTGLVAQAHGAGDEVEAKASLYRAVMLGVGIGLVLVCLQTPLLTLAFYLIDGSAEVEAAGASYFVIRIFGAPVSLAHLAIVGYLLGRQQTRMLLLVQVVLNGSNIVLDLVFVIGFGWGVAGVAAATVIAEVIALSLGLFIVARGFAQRGESARLPLARLLDTSALRRMFAVNRDITIRTLCLIFAFAWFTNEGAKGGDVVLAANAILMQFVSFSAFFLDGFALAAETLVGNATGARDRNVLAESILHTFQLGGATALLLSITIAVAGIPAINFMTNVAQVQDIASKFLVWASIAPIFSVWCYLLDGIFIGATRTIEMRNAMIISLVAFLGAFWLLAPLGNHGLWAALITYFVARGLSLGYYLRFRTP